MTSALPLKRSVILGCGGYLPEKVLTNDDLSKIVDTSDEWIVSRTGIKKRHFAAPGQAVSDLALKASQLALQNAGIGPEDLDLIVVGTATPDLTFPSTAHILQGKLGGNKRGLAFDVAGACAGFLLGLNMADNFLKLGQGRYALVVGAEAFSAILNMEDRRTCVLFGDGAGAVVLEGQRKDDSPQERGILGIEMYSDGQFHHILYADGGPSTNGKVGRLCMEGQEVYRHAVTKLTESAKKILEDYHLSVQDIDWFIPHQANVRIIESVAQKLNFPLEKVILTVQDHANTSAASIPLALWVATSEGRVKPGDLILHEAIGGGLIWGSALIRF